MIVVRKPGRAEAALQAVALRERLLHRARASRRRSVSPSTVVISQSTAETANIRQDRIGRPSTSTVQAPQTPCSQPTWVPVRPRSWRSASESSRRAGTRDVVGDAVDHQPDVVELLAHASRCRPPARRRASSYAARRTRRGEHAHQLGAVGGGGVDVVGGVELRERGSPPRERRRR